ncbi:hypothetical protein [Xenophilus sp. Marseille-Q4582]|uniref:hypothetical protein n=1 Tax=Xenophilus sp. Marseille-Q4582 TaxID=2866600 RepID=UPI001CE3FEBB|nr:hypothetical protein [Xenophilus sp. Marseille-Q4582]
MRRDLSPTALAELEIGSQQDHNARHERHTAMLQAAYEPVSWVTFAVIVMVAFGISLAIGLVLGHIVFNPFAR